MKTTEKFVKMRCGQYQMGEVLYVRPSLVFTRNHFSTKRKLTCAEIGVQRGDNAHRIYRVLSPERLVLIDCWQPIVRDDIGENYSACDDNYEYTCESFKDVSNVEIIKGYSKDVLPTLKTNSFDYFYIDGGHLVDECAADVLEGIRLVKIGGILAGHDYGAESRIVYYKDESKGVGVQQAIHYVFDGMYVNGETGDW